MEKQEKQPINAYKDVERFLLFIIDVYTFVKQSNQ